MKTEIFRIKEVRISNIKFLKIKNNFLFISENLLLAFSKNQHKIESHMITIYYLIIK